MSNLSNALQQLKAIHSQLPVSAYFDEALLSREIETLFKQGPRYIGHELMVPEAGNYFYFALPGEKEGRVLVRNQQNEIELLSNVCRHRQAIMLNGSGSANNIVCPLHRWTYDLDGQLLGAPHFADKPCLNLGKTPLQNWQGLLFESESRNVAADLVRLGTARHFDFSGFMFDYVEVHECNYNWKSFVEVYLEDYHVAPFHPGLGSFVSCDNLEWEFGDWYSVQTVGVHKNLEKPGSPTYRKWHDEVLRFRNGSPARVRRDLDGVLPRSHDRVVSARAGRVVAHSARRAENDQHRRVLLLRGNRAFRTRVHRGGTRRIYGNRARGR